MSIDLPFDFRLRDYQVEPWDRVLDPSFLRGLMVVPRRNGKDILGWNMLIAKAMQRRGLYYYVAPYYNQIRQIIWEGFDMSGRRFLDYIPPELIANKTKLDMRIDLINGSQIKLQGSDEVDRIVGTNPFGIVMTEFSLHKPAAWNYLRPVLAENGGWALFNGTPRGENHMFELYQLALSRPEEWYVQFLTRDDTGVPTLEAIERDRESGMPQELIEQEYYCSFTAGVVGSYYSEKITQLRKEGKIGEFPYDNRYPVHTSWDLGVQKVGNAIWFFQLIGAEIRWIDYYENPAPKTGLPTYAKVLQEKPYVYGTHIGPHDLEVTEWGTELTRRTQAYNYGIDFTTIPRGSVAEGIELVHSILHRSTFNSGTTWQGLQRLSQYRQKRDEKNKSYTGEMKNDAAHGADSFRMGAIGILGEYVDNFAASRPTYNINISRDSRVFQGAPVSTSRAKRYAPLMARGV
jgi:phage terminase large subunit